MEFIDKFRTLIEAEKEMRINSEMIYKYLFRVLSLFNERCNYFGLDSRSHVIDILDVVCRRTVSDTQTDINMSRLSRSEYINIPNKTTKARPNQFFLDKS